MRVAESSVASGRRSPASASGGIRRALTSSARLVAVGIGSLLVWQLGRGLHVFIGERRDFLPSPHAVPLPGDARQLGLRPVSFPSRLGVALRGWYIASRNGAVVIATHGSTGDRTARLDDARALARAGFGVLLFDWPGQGESAGRVSWDRDEREALRGAIDYVARQPDVDGSRIGVVGFSYGGYIAAQVASSDRRVRALALESAPADLIEQAREEYLDRGRAAQVAAALAVRLFGPEARLLRPIDVLASVAPRRVLIIGGAADRTVPPSEARALFAAAREPKQLVIVPRAGHGDYRSAWGVSFDRALCDFFDQGLARE